MALHRRPTYFGFRSAAKDGQLGISAILSYLLDRLRGSGEYTSSYIYLQLHNIGMRCISGCFFEYSNEAALTEANHSGKLMIGNICHHQLNVMAASVNVSLPHRRIDDT